MARGGEGWQGLARYGEGWPAVVRGGDWEWCAETETET